MTIFTRGDRARYHGMAITDGECLFAGAEVLVCEGNEDDDSVAIVEFRGSYFAVSAPDLEWLGTDDSALRAATEASRDVATETAKPAETVLRVQMRTTAHEAVERPNGIVCECGAATHTREQMARAHQRSSRVMPSVTEVEPVTDGGATWLPAPAGAQPTGQGWQCAGCGYYFPRNRIKDVGGEYYCRDGMGCRAPRSA